jgi:hypothetical protein
MCSVVAVGLADVSWRIRVKVAIGAARGLSFLHDTKSQVIYCDFPCAVTPMCGGKTHGKTNNFCACFENTQEERFFLHLSLPSETSCVSAHKNSKPVTTVGIPLVATMSFCSTVNCIYFLEKAILVN